MDTTLAVSKSESTALSTTLYDQISDPLAFIQEMGKALALSGVVGCKTVADGIVVAWACVAKRTDPFALARRYHFMKGKLGIKSEVMLADFIAIGGKHTWIKDGSDFQEAILELIGPDGKKAITKFTIEIARAAGYIKKDSNWDGRADQQLRARCTTDGIRKDWPQISSDYSVEEIEDGWSGGGQLASMTQLAAATTPAKRGRKPKSSSPDAADNAAMTLEDDCDEEGNAIVGNVAEAEVVKRDTVAVLPTKTETTPFDAGTATSTESTKSAFRPCVIELQSLCDKAEWTEPMIVEHFNKKKGTAFKSFDEMSDEQIELISENARKVIAAEEAKAKA